MFPEFFRVFTHLLGKRFHEFHFVLHRLINIVKSIGKIGLIGMISRDQVDLFNLPLQLRDRGNGLSEFFFVSVLLNRNWQCWRVAFYGTVHRLFLFCRKRNRFVLSRLGVSESILVNVRYRDGDSGKLRVMVGQWEFLHPTAKLINLCVGFWIGYVRLTDNFCGTLSIGS